MYKCVIEGLIMMTADPVLTSLQLQIHTVNCRGLDHGWCGENYIDDVARLYYVEAGEAFVQHHGKEFRLATGGMYLIPAHTIMNFWCPHQFVQHWIHFTATLFGNLDLFDYLPCRYEIPIRDPQQAKSMLQHLEQIASFYSPSSTLESTGLLMQLLAPFLDSVNTVKHEKNRRGVLRFRKVIEYIDAHLGEAIRVSSLADLIHIERTYFSRLFSRHLGVSPARYIQQRRIERSRRLLWQTDLRVFEIAHQLGFSDAFHFSKTFKQLTGLSPTEFRRQPRDLP